jgi:malate dehydrogenase (oxaloacetate-decarboxylating)
VTPEELISNYIIPSVFHHEVHQRVAAAVKAAALRADADSQDPEEADHGRNE